MKTAIINKETLQIASMYDGEPNQGDYGGPWSWQDLFEHKAIPSELNAEIIKAALDGEEIIFVTDETKVQGYRERILNTLRNARTPKLHEADVEINKHADIDPASINTLDNWKTYRVALRNITVTYKTNGEANSSVDTLDISSFIWPSKPE